MSNHLESGVLGEMESLLDCLDCMTSVGVSGNIFKNALYTHFHSRAAVYQHIIYVLFQAVVWSCFNGNTDALGLALLGVDDGLLH